MNDKRVESLTCNVGRITPQDSGNASFLFVIARL